MNDDPATPGAKAPAFKETITIVESFPPPIQAGIYTLSVTQEIRGYESVPDPVTKQKQAINYKTQPYEKKVYVAGERFAIDPSDIASKFPPEGNPGDHQNVLPHVVFSRKTLPWERKCGPDSKSAPWLALLIFHDDDPPPPLQPAMVGDLTRDDFHRSRDEANKQKPKSHSSLPTGGVSYRDAYEKTYGASDPWQLEPGQDWWDHCFVVDVPVDLFSAIAPTKEDLSWLVHSREIKRDGATGSSPSATAPEAAPPGNYSVIVANRLPKRSGASTAYLVSLEGMAAFLPGPDGSRSEHLGQAQSLRLVVLKTWDFSCSPKPETFRGYFENLLNYGPLQVPSAARASDNPDDLVVQNALDMGYAALNHSTRWGDSTISWYRGPFVPFLSDLEVSVPLPSEPLSSADEALRYDPELGMLDVTYAAAWQLGRLMAVRDKTFAYALYAWKQEVARKTCQACHTVRVNQLPHIQLLRGASRLSGEAAAPSLPADAVRAHAFRFLAERLAATLQGLDGKEQAR